MPRIFLLLAAALLFVPQLVVAQETAPTINYVGFNYFKSDQLAQNKKIFSDYIEKLVPIMDRHGMTLETYRVAHGGSDFLKAHAITVGTAPSQESFAGFAADPDFHEIFPTLVGIIEAHTVVFSEDVIEPVSRDESGHLLLATAWLKEGRADSLEALLKLEQGTAAERQKFGVELQVRTVGVMASRGLTDDLESITPPDVMALWRVNDAHGYFDASKVQDFTGRSQKYFEEHTSFWLQPW